MANTVADVVIGVSADISPLMRETARAEAAMGRFGRAMNGIGKGFSNIGAMATNLGGKLSVATAAMGVVAAGAIAITRSAADAGEAIANGAKAAGLSTTAYQEYGYALSEAADMSGEEFAAATVKLNKQLGAARDGSASAIASFERLGISAADIASGAVTGDDALAALVTTLENTNDPAIAAAIASEVLGKSGARMGGMLAGTVGQVDDLRESARGLGIIMSEDAVRASDDFNEAWDATAKQIDAVKIAIATALMPIIVDTLIPALQDTVIPAVVSVINTLGEWVTAFQELPGPVQQAIGVVAGLFAVGGPLLLAIGATASVIGALVAATGPIGLLIVAAGLLTTAWAIWGDDFKAIIGGAIDWVTAKFDAFMGLIDKIVTTLKEWKDTAKDFIGAGDTSTFTTNPNYTPDPYAIPDPFSGQGGGADVPELGGGAGNDMLGADIVDGLVNGMAARLAERQEEIGAIVDAIPQIARERLGIQSPSTVFAEIGENIGLGMAEGIAASRAAVDASIEEMNEGVLGNTASFFGSLATITQAGGDKANKAYRAFAAAEALINTYRGAAAVLGDKTVPFFAKFAAVASIVGAGMGLVNALKGGGSSSGGGSVRAPTTTSAGAASGGPMSVANITLVGDTFSKSSVEDLFKQINDGLKTGRTINLVTV